MPSSPINTFIKDFGGRLKLDPVARKRALEEARDHLLQLVQKHRANGAGQLEAERAAVSEFGKSDTLAEQILAESPVLRFLILLGTAGMWLIAAWLVSVILFLLPQGNTDQIPFWSFVTVGFIAYGALSWWGLQAGTPAWVSQITTLGSVAAMAIGAWAIIEQEIRFSRGGDWEGYILLMGLALAGYGVLNLIHAFRRRQATA